jgi:hypothetical protein
MKHAANGGRRLVPKTLVSFVLVAFVIVVWASDRITLQGERTIYTVTCGGGGGWVGTLCTGTLVAGERYAFRASRRRHEVYYWIRNSDQLSGRYSDCVVMDRDNWSCNATLGDQATITHEVAKGRPTHDSFGNGASFHDVPKWKWWLIRLGIPLFTEAEG